MVILISAMRQGPTPRRVHELSTLFGVDRATIARWQAFWRDYIPQTPFWKLARGRVVPVVEAERTLLERLVPRRSTLRSDRRPGNRAAPPSRSPFLIKCQGTERSFNAPRRGAHDAGVEVGGSAVSVPWV